MLSIFNIFIPKGILTGTPSRPKKTANNHLRNIDRSKARLNSLQALAALDNFPSQIAYVRKIDPYIFEEMILSAIESKGHNVTRNNRYSGDGGIDGEFNLNGKRILIQAKRYQGVIRPGDVVAFNAICVQAGVRGIFVHTGRTGKSAREAAGNVVELISGKKLLDLLLPVKASA